MTQDLTTKSILSLFDTDKAERASFVSNVIQAINDGHIEPLKLHVQVKCMEDILSKIKEHPEYRDAITIEAAKYGRGKHELHNATFELKATAGRYDYSHDAEWCRLRDELKAREGFLKALHGSIEIVHPDGIVEAIHPASYTPGGETVFLTLK